MDSFSIIFSSITLKIAGDVTVHGISGSLFVGGDSVFDNGYKYPEEKCFCSSKFCAPYGARYVGKCKFGAPAYVTFPHFYLADPYYTSRIDGMVPDKYVYLIVTVENFIFENYII